MFLELIANINFRVIRLQLLKHFIQFSLNYTINIFILSFLILSLENSEQGKESNFVRIMDVHR